MPWRPNPTHQPPAPLHERRWGWGGADGVLAGISNAERARNNARLLSTGTGREAYIAHVLRPLLGSVGRHAALFGFLIVNEGYSMVPLAATPLFHSSDETVPLDALRAFVNRVAGTIRAEFAGTCRSN